MVFIFLCLHLEGFESTVAKLQQKLSFVSICSRLLQANWNRNVCMWAIQTQLWESRHMCFWAWAHLWTAVLCVCVCFYSDQQDLQPWRILGYAAERKTSQKTNGLHLLSSSHLINVFVKEKNSSALNSWSQNARTPCSPHIWARVSCLFINLSSLEIIWQFAFKGNVLNKYDLWAFKTQGKAKQHQWAVDAIVIFWEIVH